MVGVGDPGHEDAVRMVDEVVAGERVDEFAVSALVRDRDGHELAVPGRRGEGVRAREEPVGVGREQRRGDEDRRVVAVARRLDDRRNRGRVAHGQLVEKSRCRHCGDHGDHR